MNHGPDTNLTVFLSHRSISLHLHQFVLHSLLVSGALLMPCPAGLVVRHPALAVFTEPVDGGFPTLVLTLLVPVSHLGSLYERVISLEKEPLLKWF